MPKHKDFKRQVRSRMSKTGESYTTARLRLLNKSPQGRRSIDHAALAGMSDQAVRAKTGRVWREWTDVLDAAGASAKSHRDIARLLREGHELPAWWSQTVAVGYERIRGLREVGQRRGGTWDANKSRTYPVPVGRLYTACRDARQRARWLPGVAPEVRTATPRKSIRLTWEDGTSVELHFTSKGRTKSSVAIQHRKLPTRQDSTRMKTYWGQRLDALAHLLTP